MRSPNFRAQMASKGHVEIEIYDMIGPAWYGMIDETVVSNAMKEVGDFDRITVRINSPGGDAYSGLAIFNLLRDQKVPVNVIVDGVAASAASIVAMAGTNVRIPKSAILMIHDPWTIALGDVQAMQKAIDQLAVVKKAAVAAYAAKTGMAESEIAKLMSDETWMTGEEAVAKKFADSIGHEVSPPAEPLPQQSIQLPYRRAPSNFRSLVAMSAAAPPVSKDDPMTTATPAAPPAAPETPPTAPTAPVAAPQMTATPAATPAPPVAQVVDVPATVQMAIATERKRVADITAMCARANCTDRAQKWINDGTAVSDVQNALFDVLCANRPPVGGDATGGPQMAIGDDKLKAEYAEGRQVYMANGITEEQFIKSRRIDLGLEQLVIGGAAAK